MERREKLKIKRKFKWKRENRRMWRQGNFDNYILIILNQVIYLLNTKHMNLFYWEIIWR